MNNPVISLVNLIILTIFLSCTTTPELGIFEGNTDIGNVQHTGSVEFDPSGNAYTITGGGTNMWFSNDELHYAWKKMSGDVSIAADIKWIGEGVDPHRKACLIIRQNLAPGSIYADAALHGDGLTAIQYREAEEDMTREIRSGISAPRRIRIEKEGDYISMSLSSGNERLQSAGGSLRLPFEGPFYVGLGVCAHNNDTLETAVFSNVVIEPIARTPDSLKKIESSLEIISVTSLNRSVVYHTKSHIEAPNWSPDGNTLIYNSGGLLYRIPVDGGTPQRIPTGFAENINNDHGISPDGTMLVISDQTHAGSSLIYSLPIEGGTPVRITPLGPSYWHGWSPDGGTLAYCAERDGNYDVYTISLKGGQEKRLTSAEGLDDGPDYSPDGKYIYFNSVRTGTMQIWRIKPDGNQQEQITSDEYNDWFPHPSPDGKWLCFISYGTDVPAHAHPANKDVMLRLMDLETGEIRVVAKIFGGQGTINVPSWSPDGEHFAFVSYQMR